MSNLLAELYERMLESLLAVGRYALFTGRLLVETPRSLLRFGLVVHQVHNAGALSLVIIMLSGLFVGMVLGLQGFDLLERFGSEDSLGTAAALGLVKELGPVVTALRFAAPFAPPVCPPPCLCSRLAARSKTGWPVSTAAPMITWLNLLPLRNCLPACAPWAAGSR